MSGRNLLEGRTGPVTQSVAAIKSLLAFVGRASDPMPSDVSLESGHVVLVLSNKKDAYYTVTEKKCSCPAASYHHGPCKHMRRYFPQGEKPTATETGSIRPDMRGFQPFDLMPGEKAVGGAEAAFAEACDTPR